MQAIHRLSGLTSDKLTVLLKESAWSKVRAACAHLFDVADPSITWTPLDDCRSDEGVIRLPDYTVTIWFVYSPFCGPEAPPELQIKLDAISGSESQSSIFYEDHAVDAQNIVWMLGKLRAELGHRTHGPHWN